MEGGSEAGSGGYNGGSGPDGPDGPDGLNAGFGYEGSQDNFGASNDSNPFDGGGNGNDSNVTNGLDGSAGPWTLPWVKEPEPDPLTAELDRQTKELQDQLAAIQKADLDGKAAMAREQQRVLSARLRITAGSYGQQEQDSFLGKFSGTSGSSANPRRFANTVIKSSASSTVPNLTSISVPTLLSGLGK
jgi:hypothetical protein